MCVDLNSWKGHMIHGQCSSSQKQKIYQRRKYQLASGHHSYHDNNPSYFDGKSQYLCKGNMKTMHRATRDKYAKSPLYPFDTNSGAHLKKSDKAEYPFKNRPSAELHDKYWYQNKSINRTYDYHFNNDYEYDFDYNYDYDYDYDPRNSQTYLHSDINPRSSFRIPLISLFSLLNVPPGSRIHCLRPGSPIPSGAVILPIIYSDELSPSSMDRREYRESSSRYQSSRLKTGSMPDDQTYEESSDSNILIQLPPPF
ncbi:hypothetical protein CLIB1423_08S02036 [[Candida] railenensis]|uniref:Uncharacterized protein n=1 Tax=[Candida] railenensis TaxID=45579 RepID=A0A9P0QP56_9ASCO|nr:hypothetical protein CLIB1423_08S02036 [[Candida] railenensis]